MEMVLAAHNQLRVRVFDDVLSLETYMRIAAVDIIVTAFGPGPEGAVSAIAGLRANAGKLAKPNFQCIALASMQDTNLKAICDRVGIDEVIAKPASPRYLEERVLARLGQTSARRLGGHTGPERRAHALKLSADIEKLQGPRLHVGSVPSNVIPLFGPRPEAPLH